MTQVPGYFVQTIWILTQNDLCKQTAEITSLQSEKMKNSSVTRYMNRNAMSKVSTHGHGILQNNSKRHTMVEPTTSYTDITDNTTKNGNWMANPKLSVCPLIYHSVIIEGDVRIKWKYFFPRLYIAQRGGGMKMSVKGRLRVTSELHKIQFVKILTFGKRTRSPKFFRGEYPEHIQNDLCTQKS